MACIPYEEGSPNQFLVKKELTYFQYESKSIPVFFWPSFFLKTELSFENQWIPVCFLL